MIRLPFVLRSTYDRLRVEETDRWHASTGRLTEANANLVRTVEREQDRYDALLMKYHELATRPTTAPIPTQEPILGAAAVLGPKTRAALVAMGSGQARQTRDAMQAEALRLHAADATDENIAKAVYQGEKIL